MLPRKAWNCARTNSSHALRNAAPKSSRSVMSLCRQQIRTPCTSRTCQSSKLNTGRSSSPRSRTFGTKSSNQREVSDSPVRVSHILSILLICGVGATAWGLYEFYSILTMWPEEVRGDLRAGLRAKSRGDMKLSIQYLTRAWEKVQQLPLESLAPDPILKVTGVAISLAEVLEAEDCLEEAFNVLQSSILMFSKKQEDPTSSSDSQTPDPTTSSSSEQKLTGKKSGLKMRLVDWLDSQHLAKQTVPDMDPKVRMRLVALALKLGDLAESLKRSDDEDLWLSFAVVEVMKLIYDEYGLVFVAGRGFTEVEDDNRVKMPPIKSDPVNMTSAFEKYPRNRHGLRSSFESPTQEIGELGLPPWVKLSRSEIAAPLERLGNYYSRHGEPMNAILLYRLASGLLVRHKTSSTAADPSVRQRFNASSIPEFCQALQIETAHLFLLIELRRNILDSLSSRPNSDSNTNSSSNSGSGSNSPESNINNNYSANSSDINSSSYDIKPSPSSPSSKSNMKNDKQKQLAQLERDIPMVIKRSVSLYNGAGRGFNRIVSEKKNNMDAEGLQSMMTLCEESYPAILYNAGVYYEETGDFETALKSYELAYKHLRPLSGRRFYEQSQMAYEGIRHMKRKLQTAKGFDVQSHEQQQQQQQQGEQNQEQGQGESGLGGRSQDGSGDSSSAPKS